MTAWRYTIHTKYDDDYYYGRSFDPPYIIFFKRLVRMKQDIVNQKSALKTAETPLGGSLVLRTLIY